MSTQRGPEHASSDQMTLDELLAEGPTLQRPLTEQEVEEIEKDAFAHQPTVAMAVTGAITDAPTTLYEVPPSQTPIAAPLRRRPPVDFGSGIVSRAYNSSDLARRTQEFRTRHLANCYKRLHLHTFLDQIKDFQMPRAWDMSSKAADLTIQFEAIRLNASDSIESLRSYDSEMVRSVKKLLEDFFQENKRLALAHDPPIDLDMLYQKAGELMTAPPPQPEVHILDDMAIEPQASSASSEAQPSRSAGGGGPSRQLVVQTPPTFLITEWSGHQLKKFKEYLWRRQTDSDNPGEIVPSRYMSKEVFAMWRHQLAKLNLVEYDLTSKSDVQVCIDTLDKVLLREFNKEVYAEQTTDVIKRRNDKLLPALREYHPFYPLSRFTGLLAEFFSHCNENEITVLNLQSNLMGFLRSAKDGRGGSAALSHLVSGALKEVEAKKIVTFEALCEHLLIESAKFTEYVNFLRPLGFKYEPIANAAMDDRERAEYRAKQKAGLEKDKIFLKTNRRQESPADLYHCNKCNQNKHLAGDCRNQNPDCNNEVDTPFERSVNGQRWIAMGITKVPFNIRLSGALVDDTKSLTTFEQEILAKIRAAKPPAAAGGSAPANKRSLPAGGGGKGGPPAKKSTKGNSHVHKKGTTSDVSFDALLSAIAAQYTRTSSTPASVIMCNLIINEHSNTFLCLLDTGCLQGNFAGPAVRSWMNRIGQGASIVQDGMCSVCSPLTQTCSDCSNSRIIMFEFLNESCNVNEIVPIKFRILSNLHSKHYDIIIGLDTLRQHNILIKLANRFSSETSVSRNTESQDVVETSYLASLSPIEKNTRSSNLNAGGSTDTSKLAPMKSPHHHTHDFIVTSPPPPTQRSHEDITGGMGFREPALSWDADVEDADGSSLPTKVFGSDAFRLKCFAILREFRDVFSRTIDSSPSHVAPMVLNVDLEKWHRPANRQPARLQTSLKEAEIRRQVGKMLETGVIRPSEQPFYSQVHLVPKATPGKWRFTIDFRNLNDCCTQAGWPLPHIDTMLQRIGRNRPSIFAKFDMTDGYHQFPLAEGSSGYTAFITPIGLFEFTRIVMGLSGSGSNFQERMAMEVLPSLLYVICEVYLDDILLYACTEDELLSNLRRTLDRFQRYHILLNPDKVEIGLSQLEFVGHLIDKEGIHMTPSKLDSIRNFPRPTYKRDMKAFLGLANYFRDHVRNHSSLAHPLQGVLDGYSAKDRNHKITWTAELTEAFENLKAAVCDCQKLYFIDDTYAVRLQTDASDYGIGAFLFQVTQEGIHPIMFISKSLDKTQCRWSTPEKEMYAIWYSLRKMDHLLRDRTFYIQTDHENLTRHKVTGSPKVIRWQLDIQQYDYTISHIKGVDNVVADQFSRLCEREDIEYCAALDPDECIMQYLPADIDESKHETFIELAALSEPITRIPDTAYKAIGQVHNSTSGHHGVERTLLKLVRVGNKWPYMREHIRLFIQKCPCCQLMSSTKLLVHTHPFVTSSGAPMQVINVDAIGPLPKDAEGNQYILTIIDKFTQFVNEMIEKLLRIVGTQHIRTLAYSKEENAIVERANKEALRHLRALVFEAGTNIDWSMRLPLVARIMNSTVHESIGVSPSSLLYGNMINLDRGIFLPMDAIEPTDIPLSEWTQSMLQQQEKLLASAIRRQTMLNERHLTDIPEDITSYPVNSFVLANYPDGPLGMRPPTKLHTNLQGPFRVVNEVLGTYTLYDLVTQKEFQLHVKYLHPYHGDDRGLSPEAVARKVRGEFIVHSIVRHTGNPARKSDMDFLVRWDGYTEADDQWLPWRALRNNPRLHEYLLTNGMAKLIPKEHRTL